MNMIINRVVGCLQTDTVKSVCINKWFYLSVIISAYVISKCRKTWFIITLLTFVGVSMLGYITHAISHLPEVIKLYDIAYNRLNSCTTSPYLKYILDQGYWFINFHETVHHDTTVNKWAHNVINEFVGNFLFQAGWFILLRWILTQVDVYAILVWGLLYSTVHNVNYLIYPSEVHMLHHVDKHTNYGIDIWDIIYGTKYAGNTSDIENINHYAINMTILTLGVVIWTWFHGGEEK